MNKYSFLLVLLFTFFKLQAQEKSEEIIISSGNSIVSSDISINWIVGENLIDYDVLFEQLSFQDSINHSYQPYYSAYPTITPDFVQIKSKTEFDNDVLIQIYNTSNKRVLSQKWSNNPMQINLSKLPASMYIIHLIDTDQQTIATFKVIKK
ncbi:T9SS type A sorting domain-containing protein [Carboxylicivirga sp. N1Y90]|uniref:T9SS type A sorting domain-containing protein n=1 Tax=Carboxylicivirga fragile TaxID=3417571 RepID=UPI003D351BBD|nr:T9SS type A sorting domain-containing protein [Marinilabiliaceae bacterium N1Y90]